MAVVNTVTICQSCNKRCYVYAVDDGEYVEFWGAPVWRPDWEHYSECCGALVEEVDGEKYAEE